MFSLFPQSGNSPLHDAAYSGFIDTVKLLLGEGADISLRNIVSVIVNRPVACKHRGI